MMTLSEKERLQALLHYLEHQQMANQCQEQLFNSANSPLTMKRQHALRDVSNRLRDEQGRFLPYNYQTMEELDLILDEEFEIQRKLKIDPIEGSYNSYAVNEKEKRDWSGNIYLTCVAAILAIAFFT
jgi:predicted nuclease with RNAse H fold